MPSNKSFRTKVKLAKASRRTRSIPQWFRIKNPHKMGYPTKKRHWRKGKLNI